MRVDPLHPTGRCACGGEGKCDWCVTLDEFGDHAKASLDQVRTIVTSWREHTELSAARCMYEIAKVLEVDPPAPVAGKNRKRMESDCSGATESESRTSPGT